MLINLLVWIIVGDIAGWLASLVVQGGGMGIVGAVILLFIVKLFTGRRRHLVVSKSAPGHER